MKNLIKINNQKQSFMKKLFLLLAVTFSLFSCEMEEGYNYAKFSINEIDLSKPINGRTEFLLKSKDPSVTSHSSVTFELLKGSAEIYSINNIYYSNTKNKFPANNLNDQNLIGLGETLTWENREKYGTNYDDYKCKFTYEIVPLDLSSDIVIRMKYRVESDIVTKDVTFKVK